MCRGTHKEDVQYRAIICCWMDTANRHIWRNTNINILTTSVRPLLARQSSAWLGSISFSCSLEQTDHRCCWVAATHFCVFFFWFYTPSSQYFSSWILLPMTLCGFGLGFWIFFSLHSLAFSHTPHILTAFVSVKLNWGLTAVLDQPRPCIIDIWTSGLEVSRVPSLLRFAKRAIP